MFKISPFSLNAQMRHKKQDEKRLPHCLLRGLFQPNLSYGLHTITPSRSWVKFSFPTNYIILPILSFLISLSIIELSNLGSQSPSGNSPFCFEAISWPCYKCILELQQSFYPSFDLHDSLAWGHCKVCSESWEPARNNIGVSPVGNIHRLPCLV